MEKMLPVRHSFRNSPLYRLGAAGMSLLFGLLFSVPALGQQIPVSGTVTNAGGIPLRGVSVHVQGTPTRVTTDANGKYSIAAAPAQGLLSFTLLGQRGVQETIAGRSTINVTMAPIAFLEDAGRQACRGWLASVRLSRSHPRRLRRHRRTIEASGRRGRPPRPCRCGA